MDSAEHSTLVKDEMNFIQTSLRDVHIDNDHSSGFLDGTEEQKDVIEKFTALNSTCFVPSRTGVKERSQKTSENGMLTDLFFLYCASLVTYVFPHEIVIET